MIVARSFTTDETTRHSHVSVMESVTCHRWVSVLEMIHAFEGASDCSVPFDIVEYRAGDMLRETWRWQSQNPDGYAS